jgi:hypothetical protein
MTAGALPCTSARLRPEARVICAVGVTPPDSRRSRGASSSREVVLLCTLVKASPDAASEVLTNFSAALSPPVTTSKASPLFDDAVPRVGVAGSALHRGDRTPTCGDPTCASSPSLGLSLHVSSWVRAFAWDGWAALPVGSPVAAIRRNRSAVVRQPVSADNLGIDRKGCAGVRSSALARAKLVENDHERLV